jgi:hypothetical protein
MNDITPQELEVWKLYAEPEYVPTPMPTYEVLFVDGTLDFVRGDDNDFLECDFGNRAPSRSRYYGPHELEINLRTLWKNPRHGVPQGVNAFSLENRRRALAILLDLPEDKIEARDVRG